MAGVVVDTNIVSYLFKGDSRAFTYEAHLAGHERLVSFMTLAELDRWALARHWGSPRKLKLARFLQRFLPVYANRTLCQWWAEVSHRAARAGEPIDAADAWIAATALALDIPLLTHNPEDFAAVDGLTILTA